MVGLVSHFVDIDPLVRCSSLNLYAPNKQGGLDNVDFSKTVIDQMNEKYDGAFYRKMIQQTKSKGTSDGEKLPKILTSSENKKTNGSTSKPRSIRRMTFQCVDVSQSLPFADDTYDVIICKGTLDSVLCSIGADLKVKKMMDECQRVLNKNGIFIVVSHGNKLDRSVYFENREKEWWSSVEVLDIPKHPGKGIISKDYEAGLVKPSQ